METWAVDMAKVGAIYPWQGVEVIMVIAGIGLWLWWHVVQLRSENEEFKACLAKYGSAEQIQEGSGKESLITSPLTCAGAGLVRR